MILRRCRFRWLSCCQHFSENLHWNYCTLQIVKYNLLRHVKTHTHVPVNPKLFFLVWGPGRVLLVRGKLGFVQQNIYQLEIHGSVDLQVDRLLFHLKGHDFILRTEKQVTSHYWNQLDWPEDFQHRDYWHTKGWFIIHGAHWGNTKDPIKSNQEWFQGQNANSFQTTPWTKIFN